MSKTPSATKPSYDASNSRKLLDRLDRLVAERDELARLCPQWESELAAIAAQINPLAPDEKQVDLRRMLDLKVSMCGPRQAEIERQIDATTGEIAVEFSKYLEPAVKRVCAAETERVIASLAGELLPYCTNLIVARARAVESPRFKAAAPQLTWFSSLHADPTVQARKALMVLDRFAATGDLEKVL